MDKVQQECELKLNTFKGLLEEVRRTSLKNEDILKRKVATLERELSLMQEVSTYPHDNDEEWQEIKKIVNNMALIVEKDYSAFSKSSLEQLIRVNENIVENNVELELNEKNIRIQELLHQIETLKNDHSDAIAILSREVDSLKSKLVEGAATQQTLTEEKDK